MLAHTLAIQLAIAVGVSLYHPNLCTNSMLEKLTRILRTRPHTNLLFSAVGLLATIGVTQTIGSGIWDAISHILKEPEQFWSIQHVAVYTGVGIVVVSAVMAYGLLIWKQDMLSRQQKHALVLIIAGAMLQIISGYADSISHDIYGIDGLVSWSHQPLELGLVTSALGALVLLRNSTIKVMPLASLAAVVLVFSIVWLVFNLLLVTSATVLCLAIYKVFSSGCAVM